MKLYSFNDMDSEDNSVYYYLHGPDDVDVASKLDLFITETGFSKNKSIHIDKIPDYLKKECSDHIDPEDDEEWKEVCCTLIFKEWLCKFHNFTSDVPDIEPVCITEWGNHWAGKFE